MILLVAFCMSELVSAYPTAGGIYWWASELGGAAWGWFTGWFNLVGLVAVVASVDYGCATFISALLNLWSVDLGIVNFADGASLGDVFIVFALVLALHALINIYSSHLVAMFNNVSVWWHVAGVAVILAILIVGPDSHQSFSFVFTETINNSGFGERHVLVLRAAARLPADAVHDHRLRRLRAHLRGDARRGGGGAEGRLALGLLLRPDRLGPAARAHVRGDRHRRRSTTAAAARSRSSTARCRTPRPRS